MRIRFDRTVTSVDQLSRTKPDDSESTNMDR
jgi:hypothetical protein